MTSWRVNAMKTGDIDDRIDQLDDEYCLSFRSRSPSRFNEAAAELAWVRSIAFSKAQLEEQPKRENHC